ncbi:Uncharacterised protein [Mycobacteroides abscessus]|nr:Uncharacterised protein [Mycobacteroides abscessus]
MLGERPARRVNIAVAVLAVLGAVSGRRCDPPWVGSITNGVRPARRSAAA